MAYSEKTRVNFPTFLTLIRLVLSPLLLPLLLVYLLPYNLIWLNAVLAFIFILFSLTDFFDGYLARKLKQETFFGRVLDPLADKFLVYSALVALLAAHKIYFYWVVILIGREFFVVGLRQMTLEKGVSVHVSFLGKLKTAAQLSYITVLIANPYQAQGFSGVAGVWNIAESVLLVLTLWLSLASAYRYFCLSMKKMRMLEEQE